MTLSRFVLVCSHPIVWSTKSKDFWEQCIHVKGCVRDCIYRCICLYIYISMCVYMYMYVCILLMTVGTCLLLLCYLCWRRLAGFCVTSSRCVLVCLHPTVWNPNSKDFWETCIHVKKCVLGTVSLYIYMSIHLYFYMLVCVYVCVYVVDDGGNN